MRVLLTSFALASHYNCLVPLGWALAAAGHEVRVASQPALTDAITASGLTAVPVGTDPPLDEVRERPGAAMGPPRVHEDRDEPVTWEQALDFDTVIAPLLLAATNNTAMVDELVAFARRWRPDLVIWEPFTLAGAVAAEACGAAHVRALWGLDVLGSARRAFLELRDRQPRAHWEDPVGEWLALTLGRYSRPFTEEAVTGRLTIDTTMPPSLRLPAGVPVVGMRALPYNGRSVMPGWLAEPPARPRVCFTLGRTGADFLHDWKLGPAELVAAAAELDVEVVATLDAQQRAALEPLPGNVRVVDFVPMNLLMPTCAVAVHHGGAGTFSAALLNGVPQLMIANTWDCPVKAKRLAAQGAGRYIAPPELDAAGFRAALAALLDDPGPRAAADRLRREMLAEPTPAELVPRLERLVAEDRAGKSGGYPGPIGDPGAVERVLR
ncbi:activator-dependent family glycosyltransferase [Bailinhaonella thermotolerans]|uniref:Activator-dependent family glycosyltransferase n=1 Tax=Bailinhaonella thermotolerans TaxID=1070861 RepID=A0A3A4B0N6_9ACTN|nr:activator-dependent family glycosyltransferase [Bailinhaonella thermotolerans]RJL31587.1 activator-dependent family glycosyltransferase [Bailinhaonella thermotolerans]